MLFRPTVILVAIAACFFAGCEDSSSERYSQVGFAQDALQMSFTDSLYTAEIELQIDPPAPANSSITVQAGSQDGAFFETDPPFRFGELTLSVNEGQTAVSFVFDPSANIVAIDSSARVEFEIVALGEGLIAEPLSGRFITVEVEDKRQASQTFTLPYEEDFSACLSGNFPPPGWREVVLEQNEENSAQWGCISSPDLGVGINAFVPGSSDTTSSEAWMLSPVIDLGDEADPALRFAVDRRFTPNNTDLENYDLLVSTDYDGDNFDAASWQRFQLGYLAMASNDPGGDGFSDVGELSLSAYAGGTIAFAFVYRAGAVGTNDATILRIADFSVQ